MLKALLTLLFVALVSCAPLAILLPRTSCYSGVYVIGARGSEEDAGFGSTASVVNGVLAAIPNSGSIALDYPASVFDPVYPDSVTDGINTLISLIKNYADSCSGKIVLVGFSQGANVITDALAGGVDKPTPLSPSYVSRISAIAVFGDPSFTHGQSFDVGTDTTDDGVFAREEGGASLALLNTYASKLRSYCDDGDVYCASGDDSTTHSQEVPTWGTNAVDFIVSQST
ncbi:putative acetylxylan esterase 2 precursor [Microthyrium microscopicum]|uniref:Putative acetylxylan esterase 2 n=1 Tax=Microthyrium microscopicum TaxID=703497 RepID=A0A6A6UF23_9PEZI|nr:putative acetylxylan esterase 2 precursor [Microthyrium microscopicum]